MKIKKKRVRSNVSHKHVNDASYAVDPRSTRKTFDRWLVECGNDLWDFDGVLSMCGSDGPKISELKIGWAHMDRQEEIEAFLIEEEFYEKHTHELFGSEYNPPKVHFIDWFNEYINKL